MGVQKPIPKVNSMAGAAAWDRNRREATGGKRAVDGESTAEVIEKKIVVNFSQYSHVYQAGIIRTLRCNCSPLKAVQRSHRYHKCRCRGNYLLSCVCKSRRYVYPPSTSNDPTESLVHGGEATPSEGKGLGKI